MTDDEILNGFMRAEYLLREYVDVIKPVADELAKRKSVAVFGEEGHYSGELGCFESGLNTVCLHTTKRLTSYAERGDISSKACEFEMAWADRIYEAGIQHVHVSGHF